MKKKLDNNTARKMMLKVLQEISDRTSSQKITQLAEEIKADLFRAHYLRTRREK